LQKGAGKGGGKKGNVERKGLKKKGVVATRHLEKGGCLPQRTIAAIRRGKGGTFSGTTKGTCSLKRKGVISHMKTVISREMKMEL